MRVLAFSTDRNVLKPDSAVRQRQRAYADRVGIFDIIVFTTRTGVPIPNVHDGNVHIYPTNSSHPLLWGWDAWWLARRLEKPEIITAQDPFETGLIAWFVAWMNDVPLHVQVHTDFVSAHYRRASMLNRVRTWIARFTVRRAARIRVVLERIAEALVTRGVTAPITVLPIFTDTTKYTQIARLKHPRFKISLLGIGRFEKEKRFDRAIRALRAARDAGHDAGLTLVGSGRELGQLKELTHTLGLERYVEFVGWKDDIVPYLAQADAVLVPSEYEGYGMVIVEALAAGVPVIATDVGVAREADAIVTEPRTFAQAVTDWCAHGPRQAMLHNQPYQSFDEYADRLVANIEATARS